MQYRPTTPCAWSRSRLLPLFTVCVLLLARSVSTRAQQAQANAHKATAGPKGKAAAGSKRPASSPTGLPELNQPFPAFTLPDAAGEPHTVAELKGKPVALYFFCGCERCQRCALTWAQLQQGGALPTAAPKTAGAPTADHDTGGPNTVIVFMGDADAARAFAAEAGLDMKRTLLLPDPKLMLTQKIHALPCPRAFALDSKGIVRYVNSHKDDDPLQASAATIVTRTLEAMTGAGQTQPQTQRVKQKPGETK